jgi:hypothetical protein
MFFSLIFYLSNNTTITHSLSVKTYLRKIKSFQCKGNSILSNLININMNFKWNLFHAKAYFGILIEPNVKVHWNQYNINKPYVLHHNRKRCNVSMLSTSYIYIRKGFQYSKAWISDHQEDIKTMAFDLRGVASGKSYYVTLWIK